MAGNFTKFIQAGVDLGFWAYIDADGYLIGSTSTAPSAGDRTGSPMLRVTGLQTVTNDIPTPESVPVNGDNRTLGAFVFPGEGATSFQIAKGAFDQLLTGKMQGTTPVALGTSSITLGHVNPAPIEYPDGAWIFQSDAKKIDGTTGSGWAGWIVPFTSSAPGGRESFETRAAANDRVTVVCNQSAFIPTGMSMFPATDGAETVDARDFSGLYPLTMHRHTGNGTEVTFNTAYRPVSVAETVTFVNGYAVTVLSVNTSVLPYSFTLSAAPANGAKIVTLYGFQR